MSRDTPINRAGGGAGGQLSATTNSMLQAGNKSPGWVSSKKVTTQNRNIQKIEANKKEFAHLEQIYDGIKNIQESKESIREQIDRLDKCLFLVKERHAQKQKGLQKLETVAETVADQAKATPRSAASQSPPKRYWNTTHVHLIFQLPLLWWTSMYLYELYAFIAT